MTLHKDSYYKINKKTFFNTSEQYHRFVNWVSGEFDLFLQEEQNGLYVFFPEGKFYIQEKKEENTIFASINLECKSQKKGEYITEKIMSLYHSLAQKSA